MYAVQTSAWMKERLDTTRIARLECFRFDREASGQLPPGYDSGDCRGMLIVSTADGESGVGVFHEMRLKGDFVQWACAFQRIKGLTLCDALQTTLLKHEAWGDERTAAVMTAIRALIRPPGDESDARTSLADCFRDSSYCFRHAEAYIIF
ncbi:hypothetical protein [Paenibacillus sacheonensis]|uniref:Uncharacterized protein n=1 Tax=Paenibacillus sacheonensis TaxID=742054 RepID=A0A7X4YVM3_9BACL|nr:hypothetical protein [Paenibacillus sacheonensis]MBM7568668.1 hypothetical protein [Paenibacillus sacheonensis]NBC72441.1 hypothetical protein [Paenibacillus sacheonensis]